MMASRPIIFTDLDGTLLDFETYSPERAASALQRLRDRQIPVVFCSSKTAAEQRPIRHSLGLDSLPFIVENGSAIIIPEPTDLEVGDWSSSRSPDERTLVLGLPSKEIRRRIKRIATLSGISLSGFADLGTAKVATLTGLDQQSAERAIQRDYSETLVDRYPPETWEKLDRVFEKEGLRCFHGGRFHTVTGLNADKGRATTQLSQLYRQITDTEITTIGLGDSANDIPMLEAVDHAVLIGHTKKTAPSIVHENLTVVSTPGAAGWSEFMQTKFA